MNTSISILVCMFARESQLVVPYRASELCQVERRARHAIPTGKGRDVSVCAEGERVVRPGADQRTALDWLRKISLGSCDVFFYERIRPTCGDLRVARLERSAVRRAVCQLGIRAYRLYLKKKTSWGDPSICSKFWTMTACGFKWEGAPGRCSAVGSSAVGKRKILLE